MTKVNLFSFPVNYTKSHRYRYINAIVASCNHSFIHHQYLKKLYPTEIIPSQIKLKQIKVIPFLNTEKLNKQNHINKKFIKKVQSYANKPKIIINNNDQSILFHKNSNQLLNNDLIKSFIFHTVIISTLFIPSLLKKPNYGNTSEGNPVDVVFLPQELGSSGMKGEGYTGEKAMSPPPPPTALPAASTPEEISPSTPIQTIPEVNAEAIPIPKEESEAKNTVRNSKKKITKNKVHEYTYKYNQPSHKRVQSQQHTSSSPFDNLVSPDFSENPNMSKRQRAEHKNAQGSKSGMNMSLGPLVKNGKMNHPYSTKISIKGVNDDYGQEIARWIRSHLYYPIDAAKRGESGGPSVHVELDRDGNVLSVSLTNSSGSEALDAAITGMFRNAQLPKIPPDLPDHFSVDLKINYILLHY